ncbi:hypothetical protein ACE01N_19735 [Saccharicrinis sp. FJH2]|uniref:hypothetical protein n=1 Tax=Saccharicrinis sp. FJH65 TaxID=3344659 RepID=UPI0035F3D6AC
MKILFKILAAVFSLIILTSCEGFKRLAIYNTSINKVMLTIKPGIEEFNKMKITDYPTLNNIDSVTKIIEPDSAFILLSKFTNLTFNTKIKESDLKINYIRIVTKNDTIIANSKKEIVNLIYKNRERNIKTNGRNWVIMKITK